MRIAVRRAGLAAWLALLGFAVCTAPLSPSSDDAFGAVFAAVAAVTRGLAAYLLAATVIGAAAHAFKAPTLHRAADRLTPQALQRCLAAALCAGTLTVAASPRPSSADPAVVQVVVSDAANAASSRAARAQRPQPMVVQPPIDPASRRWTVRPGDHFWSIAVRVAPCPSDVRDVWRQLIGLNADRLVDRGNPDLLLPGQVLRLPAEPTAEHPVRSGG